MDDPVARSAPIAGRGHGTVRHLCPNVFHRAEQFHNTAQIDSQETGPCRTRSTVVKVQSISRAFAVLRALAVGPQGVTDVADHVGLPKSTVARLLTSLEAVGAVAQDDTGGDYRIGQGLIDIIGAAGDDRGLLAAARPHLHSLVNQVGETAGVSVRADRTVYYLDQVQPESEVQVRSWIGEYCPLHLVPSGLVYLAHLSPESLEEYFADGLEATTANSMVDPDALWTRLAQIASAGYVWVYEEFAVGINSAAAPVLNEEGTVVAALHVHGPAYRFPDPNRTHDIGLMLIAAASNLADHLAGRVPLST